MRIDLDHLRIFHVVAQVGSFAAAGEVLHISQSAISRTIQILEDRLGVKLFIRLARGLGLTVHGERLYKYTTKAIDETDQIIRLISEINLEPQGELKIITTPHMGSSWLMVYLRNFLEQYPNLKLRIVCKTHDINIEAADAVICTAIPHHPNLIHVPLKKFPMGFFASQSYLKKFGTPKRPEELDNHLLLTYGEEHTDPYGNFN